VHEPEKAVAYTRETTVRNKEGLHFRPIMRMVDLASQFTADVTVCVEDRKADARSPMELLMLVATTHTKVKLVGNGPDERDAVDRLAELIETGFGETIEAENGKT
jgi:phosphotransferase system HPr (HPr) family protein